MLSAQHRLRDSADFASTVRGRTSVRSGSPLLVVHTNLTDSRAAEARAAALDWPEGVLDGPEAKAAACRQRARRSRAWSSVGRVPAGTHHSAVVASAARSNTSRRDSPISSKASSACCRPFGRK